MSENKFIKHLKGEDTAKSVLEIKNQRTTTSFANMPSGTSNANDVYSDHRGNAIGVLRGTDNWKVAGINSLINATTVYGDGRDVTGSYNVSSNSLWVDATYTFTGPKTFAPNTKFVLKLCGERLSNTEDTVPFSLVITIGNAIVTKSFTIREHAFEFSEEFVIDFTESNSALIKCVTGNTMRVQLLCGSADASATIYTGMTVFTALQRRVDGDAVVSDKKTFDETVEDVEQLQEDLDDLEEYVDDTFVRLDGTSIMTAPLKFMSGSVRGAVGPYFNGVGFWKMSAQGVLTQIAALSDSQFIPTTTNAIDIGSSTKKWKDLYLSGNAYFDKDKLIRFNGTEYNRYFDIYNTSDTLWFSSKYGSYEASLSFRAYTGAVTLYPNNDNQAVFGLPTRRWNRVYATNLCSDTNGVNLIGVPNKAGTMALMSDVELAARSGRMITDQGVWYAKMYAATVPPAAENGTNYADFSQVDGDNNPIIVIYERQSGAWVQTEIITPPAEYDGYVPITSKIWDIAEQTDQQGGRILWNHTSKEFTPYPLIISTDSINITNSSLTDCTVTMPYSIATNSAVNAGWVINRQGWQDIEDYAHGSSATTVILEDDKSIYLLDNITQNLSILISTTHVSVTAGNAKTFELHLKCTGTPTITWNGIDAWLVDSETTPVEADKTSIFVVRVQQMPNDVSPTVVANYGGAY